MVQELAPEQLRRACDPESFSFETTADLPLTAEIIGQQRAAHAIEFGLEIQSPGYSIFVLGPGGSGRTTTIQRFLAERAARNSTPDDWVYVNNFRDERQPRALRLPAGVGTRLRDDMAELVADLRQAIPRAFEAETVTEARGHIEQQLQAAQAALLRQMNERALKQGFGVMRTPSGLMLAPMRDGQPMSPERLRELPVKEQQRITVARQELEQALSDELRLLREREREARDAAAVLDRDIVAYTVGHAVDDLKARYADLDEVVEYLEEVQADIVERAAEFRQGQQPPPPNAPAAPSPFVRYVVNLFVDSSQQKGAPVIVEANPTFHNLIGRIEHAVRFGVATTDFSMLKAGALHRANGGYLVARAKDVLSDPLAWQALKQALTDRLARLEERGIPAIATVTLRPQPIPLDVKVILLGSPGLYYLLYAGDEDFRKLFKVRADFSSDMERTPENEALYALFIRARCDEEGLRPFDRRGAARVVEFGSRLAEDQRRLSIRFGDVADLLRESNYWAGAAERDRVTAEDVERAVAERTYRANRVEEEIQRVIAERKVLIATEGEVVGQVNGLALNIVGGHVFGRPTRITARTFAGRGGVVDIQREVKLSAPSHGKGVLTLAGYLGGQYASRRPLTLSASLSFEQIYDEVRGDSASLAELVALLSSLSGLPVRQGLAITGSLDQQGQVQPVGGVTYKIEGFYKICRARGLTGDQGAVIPAANANNLALPGDVIQDVAEGRFHVYTVTTVDEAIEILTGVPAGARDKRGRFPKGTVHALVHNRLLQFSRALQRTAKSRSGGRRGETGEPLEEPGQPDEG
jgi:lon-related putative ATP-dependent protease